MKSLSCIGSFVLALVGLLSFASCQYDIGVDPSHSSLPSGESAEFTFLARIPDATVVATRGETGTGAENRIEDIYVLVFKTTGELVYKGKGRELDFTGANDNNVTFKATLPVGTVYDFMVLANAETLLADNDIEITDPAKSKTDVEAILQHALAVSGTHKPWNNAEECIPMWDEQRLTLSTSTGVVFNLMRMMARVNVEYKQASGTESRFQLTNVRYYNYNAAGKVVPASANLTGTGAERRAGAATLPSEPVTQFDKFLSYDATNDACKNEIYVFEAANRGKYVETNPADAANWIGNPCLVIGGKYDTDKDNDYLEEEITWYRIDFIRSSDQSWLSVLRNFTYNVTITSVSGQGYADPDVALKSAPMNVTAGVIDWNDGQMEDVLFDGTAYLSVDRNEFRFERSAVDEELADKSNVLKIKTDYTVNGFPANSGWRAEYYTDPEGTIEMTNPWLKLVNGDDIDRGDPTGTQDDPAAVTHFEFTENNGSENRQAWVYIVAGRLRYRVHVVQRLLSLEIVDPDAGNTPVEEMFFVVPRASGNGGRPQVVRHFTVNWTPIADIVATGNESPRVWNPFAPEWIAGNPANTLPAPDANGVITNGTGTQGYTVTAPAVTDAELSLDPFYERESNYTFMVDNGLDAGDPSYDYVQKSINLHQIYYNIIVDTYKYRLDGGTATITVRSNTEWEIIEVEEWLYNEDPATVSPPPTPPVMLDLKSYDNLRVGTTGGPNVNGEALAFTTVSNESGVHDGKWGTVYVTFHSPTGKFPDHRVALPFPPASRLLLGLGYAGSADTYACNPGIGTSKHHNSVFQMLTSPYNFGSMEESTFKVEGFRVIGYNAEGPKKQYSPTMLKPDEEWHTNSMVNWLNNDRPDIIAFGDYTTDTYAAEWGENEIQLIDQYVDNGGAVLLMYNGAVGEDDRMARMLEVLLDKSNGRYVTSNFGTVNRNYIENWISGPASGAAYELGTVDDPILNGPFGDVRGLRWGAHYHVAGILSTELGSDIVRLGNSKATADTNGRGNANFTSIFRHKTKNIVFILSNGFGASNYREWQQGSYPQFGAVAVGERFFEPIGRGNWGPPGTDPEDACTVYNSTVIANSVAWLLTVTNHQPPAGGYVNYSTN